MQSKEINRGRDETRTLQTCAVTPEQVCFPAAAQAAVLRREVVGRKPETVHLLTSLEADQLPADRWLRLNRNGWGIENGLHQRLDVTGDEDRSRVRDRNAVWVLGMFRRLAVSIFIEWRSHDPKRRNSSMRDFYDVMSLNHQRSAFNLVAATNPKI